MRSAETIASPPPGSSATVTQSTFLLTFMYAESFIGWVSPPRKHRTSRSSTKPVNSIQSIQACLIFRRFELDAHGVARRNRIVANVSWRTCVQRQGFWWSNPSCQPLYLIPFVLINFRAEDRTRLPGFAPNTKQRSDGGVDGRATIYTKPENFNSRLALAQVKGGKFGLSQLRDFIHVTDRDKAALGVYLTLDPVTSRAAHREAAKAKTVRVGADKYPRCQLWPISNHFEGHRPHLPTMTDPYTGKPLAQRRLNLFVP